MPDGPPWAQPKGWLLWALEQEQGGEALEWRVRELERHRSLEKGRSGESKGPSAALPE